MEYSSLDIHTYVSRLCISYPAAWLANQGWIFCHVTLLVLPFSRKKFNWNRSINKKVQRSSCREFQTDGQNIHPWLVWDDKNYPTHLFCAFAISSCILVSCHEIFTLSNIYIFIIYTSPHIQSIRWELRPPSVEFTVLYVSCPSSVKVSRFKNVN